MQTKLLIPAYNNLAAQNVATAVFSPVTADTLSWNSDLNNVNNSGLLFVTQLPAGNVNASYEIWGSIDGVNFSTLVPTTTFTSASGGQAQTLAHPVTFPPYIRLRLIIRAHDSVVERSGVAVWITY
jgi:hypothetical protein